MASMRRDREGVAEVTEEAKRIDALATIMKQFPCLQYFEDKAIEDLPVVNYFNVNTRTKAIEESLTALRLLGVSWRDLNHMLENMTDELKEDF